jgi:hypothetical protein
MPISEGLRNRWLNQDLRDGHLVLHSGDPGANGTENVIDLPRTPVVFAPAKQGMVVSSTPVIFSNMPHVVITHITIWDAPEGGELKAWEQLDSKVPVLARGTFVIETRRLTIAIS